MQELIIGTMVLAFIVLSLIAYKDFTSSSEYYSSVIGYATPRVDTKFAYNDPKQIARDVYTTPYDDASSMSKVMTDWPFKN